jgi:Tol biopolymer transport system component
MRKLLLLLVLGVQTIFAQTIQVTAVSPIKTGESGGMYHPVFSPTGEYLLCSSENYEGLKMISFLDNQVKTLTTEKGAGYGVKISSDGKTIVFRKNELINHRLFSSVQLYSVSDEKQQQLVAPTREPLAVGFSGNKPLLIKNRQLVKSQPTTGEIVPVVTVEDRKMVLYKGNLRQILTPNGENASYIWPSISPDNQRIVYVAAGKGTFVCDMNGKNVSFLGKLNAPQWINNQWVVGMDDIDNGEVLLSSSLVAATIDGKVYQKLTTSDLIAMYPAVSPDGKVIAFNTANGDLYLLNIIIK